MATKLLSHVANQTITYQSNLQGLLSRSGTGWSKLGRCWTDWSRCWTSWSWKRRSWTDRSRWRRYWTSRSECRRSWTERRRSCKRKRRNGHYGGRMQSRRCAQIRNGNRKTRRCWRWQIFVQIVGSTAAGRHCRCRNGAGHS